MINFHELPRTDKDALKPVLAEVRKHLYGNSNKTEMLRGGLTINFGKRREPRYTLRIQIVG
ncbi:hypothetical protein LCGC14_2233780 [marine sediment metagenome]|uniref:Uncharacterized protein n=1 Tax=marine sediment metagenome TaxID=412755 RepID=A0A0F9G2J3_9ZZZZ